MVNHLVSFLTIVFFSIVPMSEENVEMGFYGIWRTIDNQFIQIDRNFDFETKFQRVSSNKRLLTKGLILEASNGIVKIKRNFPKNEVYDSNYKFSPSGKTLVIMKPNGKEAWVLERVR